MSDEVYRILVPLDGSPTAESVLPALMPIARNRAVELTFLRVVPTAGAEVDAMHYLERVQGAVGAHGIVTAQQVECGPSAPLIVNMARDQKFDLVAMSTHGRTGWHHLLVGSVAEAVVRDSTFPVLLNRPDSRIGDWTRILVALDGTGSGRAILADAEDLARRMGATLHLVRVGVRGMVLVGPDVHAYTPPEDPWPYLHELAGGLRARGIVVHPVGLQGEPGRMILEHARAIDAGLLCLTTHARQGVERVLLGSVAEEVIRRSSCPVLVRRRME